MASEITVLIGRSEDPAVVIAGRDLVHYLRRVLPTSTPTRFLEVGPDVTDLPSGDLIVVNPGAMPARLADRLFLLAGQTPELVTDGYAIRVRPRPEGAGKLVLLEGSGKLGIQYACYDFARRYLGVRYLRPDYEHVPSLRRLTLPVSIDLVENPRYKYRGLWAWAYTDRDTKSNWEEFIFWYRNADDAFKLLRLADWVIKHRGNVLFWYNETYFRKHMYMPEEYQRYVILRGLQRVEMVSPASAEGKDPEDMKYICRAKDGSQIGTWNTHLCIKQDRFWQVLDKQIDGVRPENLAGVVVTWSEASCGQPGHCDDFTQRCAACGDVPNADKHLQVIDYVRTKLAERGIQAPVGHYRHWKMGPDGDARHAHDLLERAGDDFLSFIHTCGVDVSDIYSEWWKTIRRKNESGGKLKVWYCPETQVMCQCDTPIVNLMNLDSREYDYRKLQDNPDTEFHIANLTTQKYLGWQMAHYTFACQWGPFRTWQDHFRAMTEEVFGRAASRDVLTALKSLYPVTALLRSQKFGVKWERKYWYLYANEVLLDLGQSFNIRTPAALTRKADVLRRDLLDYDRELDRVDRALARGRRSCRKEHAGLYEQDFEKPLRWTAAFFRSRVQLLLAVSELARPTEANARKSLARTLLYVRQSLAALETYYFAVQECGSDFPKNIRPQSLAALEAILADQLTEPGAKPPRLRNVLSVLCAMDDTARRTLGKLLSTRKVVRNK